MGDNPVAAVKACVRYSSVEKPERLATSFAGRFVDARSLFASSMRA